MTKLQKYWLNWKSWQRFRNQLHCDKTGTVPIQVYNYIFSDNTGFSNKSGFEVK